MAFTRTWSITSPANTDLAKYGARDMRYFKVDIQERVAIEHSFAGDASDGIHAEGSARITRAAIAPSDVLSGRLWYDTSLKRLMVADGAEFTEMDLSGMAAYYTPPGVVLPYGGASAPTGWLLCDGAAVSRTTYAGLFAVIASTFGDGDGSTTFNVPDLRSRTPLGAGTGTVAETATAAAISVANDTMTVTSNNTKWITGMAVVFTTNGTAPGGLTKDSTYYLIRASATTIKFASSLALAIAGTAIDLTTQGTGNHTITHTLTARTVGEVGGEESHGLGISEMPSHGHPGTARKTGFDPGSLSYQDTLLGEIDTTTPDTSNRVPSQGASAAHNNIQPFLGLNYIIKT